MNATQQDQSLLADLVRRFRVCWEVWPEDAVVDSVKRQIGYALELYGTHEAGSVGVQPGCHRCHDVFDALRRIAEHIVPREMRPSIASIGPYDQALHYSPVQQSRAEVKLEITLLHQSRIEDPVDACEIRCLNEMKQRLKNLGARERQRTSGL